MSELLDYIDWDKVDNKIKMFSLEGTIQKGKCVHVYDGDTIKIVFPLHGELLRWSVRISGVDTPEIRTKNKLEKLYGYKVKKKLQNKILNKIIYLECEEFDKYGRLLGYIYLIDDDQKGGSLKKHENLPREKSINQWLIDNEYAFSYDGGTKKKWSDFLQKKIEKME
jgi:endonuclease YncB( thermonuclease family)